ncbi:MAG TPA: hypothetical protein VF331_26435, partial [Polyangiales bacterium]
AVQPQPSTATAPANALDAVPNGPVDVVIPESAPAGRSLAIEWNPLPFFTMHTGVAPSDPGRPPQGGLGKLSLNVIFAPAEHHALIVSPFYVLTRTTPITIFDNASNPTRLPIQTFRGFGAELGYRYYSGRGGLRGVFVGPSWIIGSFTATAENGAQRSYLDFGGAADVGYQTLVLDCMSLSLGVGLQYTTTSKSIPEQMLWAKVFANSALFPRVLASIGWAL